MRFEMRAWALLLGLFWASIPVFGWDVGSNWTSLTVSAAQRSTVLPLLKQAGIPFLDADHAEVEISNYDTLELVPLNSLPNRFEPEDPRWDAYLKELPALFRSKELLGESYRIWIRSGDVSKAKSILPSSIGTWAQGTDPSRSSEVLRAGKNDQSVFSLKGLLDGLMWVSFWAALFLLRKKLWTIVLGLVWTLVVFATGGVSLWALAGASVSWGARSVVRRLWNVRKRREEVWDRVAIGLELAGFVAFAILTVLSWFSQNFAVSALKSGLFVVACGLVYGYYRLREHQLDALEHALFTPVRLKTTNESPQKWLARVPKAAWGAFAVSVLALAGSSFFFSSVQQNAPESSSSVELYRRHLWFQSAFVYGAQWDDYTRSTVVSIPEYQKTKGKITESDREVLRGDEKWWDEKIQALSPENVATLFFPQTP